MEHKTLYHHQLSTTSGHDEVYLDYPDEDYPIGFDCDPPEELDAEEEDAFNPFFDVEDFGPAEIEDIHDQGDE